ncbi:MAG: YdcF family protein [Clostridia bacterium]|nr:YdcF family protein [Clostridia bacterium]
MHKIPFPLRLILWFLAFCMVCYLFLIGMVWYKENHVSPPAEDPDAIVVLGAQVRSDGTPSLQLQWRLESAIEAYAAHPCPVVVCGAQGADEPKAEALVMRDILLAAGVRDTDILTDDTSFNTRENLLHAQALLKDASARRVLVVTSDYHLPRALALAQDLGFEATGRGSPTLGGYHWLKNHAREALSWVKYWLQKYTPLWGS